MFGDHKHKAENMYLIKNPNFQEVRLESREAFPTDEYLQEDNK